MKKSIQALFLLISAFVLVACGTTKNGWNRIANSELDQKSYAIGYGATAQSYQDRVNESYDIDSFMNGVSDWYEQKIALPIEQVKANTFGRMLDHNVYAYYSGAIYASDLRSNFNRLSLDCWKNIETKSITQGIHDAMLDLQKNKVRHDDYITKGADEIIQLCVKEVEKDEQDKAKGKRKGK